MAVNYAIGIERHFIRSENRNPFRVLLLFHGCNLGGNFGVVAHTIFANLSLNLID